MGLISARRELLAWVALVILVVACCPVAWYRVVYQVGGTDFPGFYEAGRYVLEHQARHPRTLLHRFLPSVDVAWAAVAAVPLPIASVCWYGLNVLAWVGLLRQAAGLLSHVCEHERRAAVLATAALTIVPVLDHLLLGAFHLPMLWLMVAGLGRALRGRQWSGGVLLGVAVWLKILPGLGTFYLLFKRRWQAAAASVLVAAAMDVGLSVLGYGPTRAWETHVTWWHSRAVGDLGALLTRPGAIEQQRDRNQSPAAVMRRVLTRMGADESARAVIVSVCDLSPRQLQGVFLAAMGLLAGSLAYYWRKPAAGLSDQRKAGEVALVVLATMWFCPVVWSYHPTAGMPALAVVLSAGAGHGRLKPVVGITWLVAVLLLGLPHARAAGEFLWASLLLGAAVVMVTRHFALARRCCSACETRSSQGLNSGPGHIHGRRHQAAPRLLAG